MKHYIGIDIGGTEIKYAVFGLGAELLYHDSVKTPKGQANIRIPEQAAGIIAELLEKYEGIQGVGISTAGVVDPASGEIVFAGGTIPEYKGTNLKTMIQDRFGLRAIVANDVNAAACGEKWKGAAQGSDHFFCMTLGTGVGGALFCEGKLVVGSHFRAGEIGHSLYDKSTRTTYEQRASMTALLNKASLVLPEFTGSGHELFANARMGSECCNAIIDGWAEEIARGLAEIILLADPSLILIGGGVSEQKAFLLDKIKARLDEYLPANFSKTELKAAELGNRAALYGAVYPYYNDETEWDSNENRHHL
ncbi:ROK family protein [Paenibacillus sp. LHD-38]|uniref:ROK family protein n=1 Tax=Paenibacillus sp. LHD-38 TaxID=3072143 RepID=UPI00280CE9E8|nr:ROK family protein [Paenibacillus sp. LHD-38]MDQ8738479.1 ROK family protein [Paenibacillus sp. LHD-38]